MVKISKVLFCGMNGTGKTAIIEQLLYANHAIGSPMIPTIEDIYTAVVDTDRGQKEKIRIYDISGLDGSNETHKHYLNYPDAFVMVYDITNFESFKRLDKLKKDIDKHHDKRDIHIIALGNKTDLADQRQVDYNTAQAWASKEKVRLWEVNVSCRQSLVDPFQWLASKMTAPTSKSTFLPSRKAKASSNTLVTES
ncbi:NF-kappa-B inhibitor-interacting Ras-like protein 1 [Gigantopelta aegis]|uniref:NF-kappa-B inhibitor-interacting Ras-like protein 1 n=1 Tax=Gigantopelta aegis TaxID=1735272 RepID=UPI001B88A0DD|nr:NF-kappa-B inhibitor-interacting Ras-like protein 1 [Gigantopelta aegis]